MYEWPCSGSEMPRYSRRKCAASKRASTRTVKRAARGVSVAENALDHLLAHPQLAQFAGVDCDRSRASARASSQQSAALLPSASSIKRLQCLAPVVHGRRSVQCAAIPQCRCRKASFAPPARRPIPKAGSAAPIADTTQLASRQDAQSRRFMQRKVQEFEQRTGRGATAAAADVLRGPTRARSSGSAGGIATAIVSARSTHLGHSSGRRGRVSSSNNSRSNSRARKASAAADASADGVAARAAKAPRALRRSNKTSKRSRRSSRVPSASVPSGASERERPERERSERERPPAGEEPRPEGGGGGRKRRRFRRRRGGRGGEGGGAPSGPSSPPPAPAP